MEIVSSSSNDQPEKKFKYPFESLFTKYDATFIVLYGCQYFSQGTISLVALATANLFKETYQLDPGQAQFLSNVITLPWIFKIVYGLISDNFPIFGSKRRSYLVILAVAQFVGLQTVSYYTYSGGASATICTCLLTISSLSIAAMDVIADSIMVVQSRRFPEAGSVELQTYSWSCLGLGGIVGSVSAAILTERYDPSYSFFAASLPALVSLICSAKLSPQIERGGDERV
jgi:MFS family permease